MGRDPITRALLAIVVFILVIAALRETATVTMPLAIALFLVVLVWPVQRDLQRHVPGPVALGGALLVIIAVLVVFGTALFLAAHAVALKAPLYAERLDVIRESLLHRAHEAGWPLDEDDLALGELARHLGRNALAAVRSVVSVGGVLVLILAFMALTLLEVGRWRIRLVELFAGMPRHDVLHTFGVIATKFRKYMVTRTVISALTGLATGLFTLWLDVDLPLVWAVSTFLLNFIPVLGSFVAVMPPTLIALVQFESGGMGLAVLAGLGVIQIGLGAYAEPLLQGRNLEISPLMVLFSVVFWGWVWGIPGALIGVPLTVVVVIALGQFPGTRWAATLLGDRGA